MMKSKNSIFFELTGKKDNEVFHIERFIKWAAPNCIVIAITSDKFSWMSWIFILIYSFEMCLLTQLLSEIPQANYIEIMEKYSLSTSGKFSTKCVGLAEISLLRSTNKKSRILMSEHCRCHGTFPSNSDSLQMCCGWLRSMRPKQKHNYVIKLTGCIA